MSQTERPNVLLICTDHWGGHYLRTVGHPVVMTPTVHTLAQNGVCYTNAYSAAPTCIPARRSLMTGTTARTHGDRVFKEFERMPDPKRFATMPQCFRDAGYQAYAVGKLHVHPQRDRIGFDEVILIEEGRHHLDDGVADDWELYLQDRGFAGQEYAAGHCNNDMITRAWHLPEACHPTHWVAREMCRTIVRRDPTKPAFWYLSFVGPHQPMWPLQAYMDLYRDVPMDDPVIGDWAKDEQKLPHFLRSRRAQLSISNAPAHEIDLGRRAFYACITHIDHQIRTVIGTLREQGLLGNTIIAFTADHGEMLGDHGLWTKAYMYERSNRIPLVISLPPGDERLPRRAMDDRLVEIRDVMPTLLDLCRLETPSSVEGESLTSGPRRDYLYGEHGEDAESSNRMIRDQRYKLIYYPMGNIVQLFDIDADPRETHNLADDPDHARTRERLTRLLVNQMYGEDDSWVQDGQLVGVPAPQEMVYPDTRVLAAQRGHRFI